jgi:hypothetical protein
MMCLYTLLIIRVVFARHPIFFQGIPDGYLQWPRGIIIISINPLIRVAL